LIFGPTQAKNGLNGAPGHTWELDDQREKTQVSFAHLGHPEFHPCTCTEEKPQVPPLRPPLADSGRDDRISGDVEERGLGRALFFWITTDEERRRP
jgi:hypothetical protein